MEAKRKTERTEDNHKRYPVWLLDPGHGGIIDSVYQTSGKRSPKWDDGRILYEGEFNRAIAWRIMMLMEKSGYPCINLVETDEDMPLEERTDAANKYYEDISKDCILLSLHANAGGGTGKEVFTSKGQTASDPFAEILIEELDIETPELRLRKDMSDGDHDKEAQFWMLRKTKMPAVLVEFAFMDTLTPDCELLMSEEGRDRFAMSMFRGIKRINESYYN